MKRTSTLISITSGKGGVGKSVVSVNLAETLVARGHRVALVDADAGQGACAVLMNETPAASVADVVRRTAPLEATLHETAAGITLLQAAAEPGQTEGREDRLYGVLDQLLRRLRRDHDVILVDAPAGTGLPVRWALDRADLGALVLVDEPTAVADAYRLAKLVWQADPDFPLAAIVNFADDAEHAAGVADRFGQVTRHFFAQAPTYLGWVPFSAAMRQAVRSQRPANRSEGPLRTAFSDLAETLMHGRTADAPALTLAP